MRRVIVSVALAALLCLQPAFRAHAQLLDWIVAVVNGDAITLSELEFEIDRVERSIASSGTAALPSRDELRTHILELIIDKRLQLQRGETLGITVRDGNLERIVENYRQDNGLVSEEAFSSFLNGMGVSREGFEDILKEDVIIQEAVRRDVFSRMNITEEEIERQVRKLRKGSFEEEYRLRYILVRAEAGATRADKEQKRAFAEELRNRFQAGEKFESLAALHSDAESALEGGDIGWRGADLLPDEFLSTLEGMESGEISPVIEVGDGFHLLLVEEIRRIPTEIGRILVHLKIISLDGEQEDAIERANDIHERILAGESFEELAREYSVDPGSADNGGDVGWLDLAELLPSLAQTVAQMENGEISRPVRSSLGLHIVSLVDQSVEMIDEETLRAKAIQGLRERHLFEARQNWVDLLRSNAHIEIKESG